jgi:hypothetical protein
MPYYNNTRVGGAMDADHIYYSINISNDSTGVDVSGTTIVFKDTSNVEKPLSFNQVRAQPYLINPSEYFMSVQRFTVETPNLPVFIVQPILGQTNNNKTIYQMTIYNNTTNGVQTANLTWSPSDLTITAPTGTVTTSAYTNPYYYCYSYNYFLNLLNNLLRNMLSSITGYNGSIDMAPAFIFNAQTGLFSISAPVNGWRTSSSGSSLATNTNKYFLYMNASLYNLFSSIPSLGTTPASLPGALINTKGNDYLILFTTGDDLATPTFIVDVSNNSIGTPVDISGNYNWIYKTQDYPSLPLWTPISSIVIRASLLNIVSEMVATPVVYQNGTTNINAGKQNTNILPILLEFSLSLKTGTEYKPYVYYEPTAEFRLSDLYSDVPVNGLQFDVFWKDTFGNLNPLNLALNASATLRLLFRKKTFNSNQI